MIDLDSLTAALRASASRFETKPCLVSPSRSVSFVEFAAHVSALADRLRKLGIVAGDRVAILDVGSVDYLECLYSLAAVGAIAVPLNYRQRVGELRYRNSDARLLLAGQRYSKEAGELQLDLPLDWLGIGEFYAEAARPGVSAASELMGVDGRTAFAICYTSGTTGRPKGAVVEQRGSPRELHRQHECRLRS
jgi:fatty-acyl-CoA synthase